MTRPRTLRLLRIAVSAVCGLLCLLMVVLWVRSCWREDTINGYLSPNDGFSCIAMGGRIILAFFLSIPENSHWVWYVNSDPTGTSVSPYGRWFGFGFLPQRGTNAPAIIIPYWFPTLLFGLLAALPWLSWLRWRFSLRTLLLATTLVAVVLGLVVAVR
jgi:hypothetical protein